MNLLCLSNYLSYLSPTHLIISFFSISFFLFPFIWGQLIHLLLRDMIPLQSTLCYAKSLILTHKQACASPSS